MKPPKRSPTLYQRRGTSLMFAAHYEDGRVAYFVVQGTTALDLLPAPIALERQRSGELPQGVIKVVKQVR